MTVPIIKETKNYTALTTEGKSQPILNEANFSWDESDPATWNNVGVVLTNEQKNTTSLTKEQKNA